MTNTAAGGRCGANAAEGQTATVARTQLPAERAEFFYLRARRLYELGGQYSVVLERVVTTILKVPRIQCALPFTRHLLPESS